MERPAASLTYKGSISDAILEAQTQKKLFVVYISGDDENWLMWEQSIFKEPSVAESISKYCIFLQLMQGSLDASQFSAIYPQKSIPSISVVGYSGALLWNDGCLRASGGYLDARDFVNKIHEAWVTVHLQVPNIVIFYSVLPGSLLLRQLQQFCQQHFLHSLIMLLLLILRVQMIYPIQQRSPLNIVSKSN